MNRWLSLLLAVMLVLGLCACGEDTATDTPTKVTTESTTETPTQPSSLPQPSPDDPPEPTPPDPVGVYCCIGISMDGSEHYDEVDSGQLRIYADLTGDIYFNEYYHDFTWVMQDGRFLATASDESAILMEGLLTNGVMELQYRDDIRLRFRMKTQQELDQESVDGLREFLVDSPMQLVVAYLGWYEGDEDFSLWLSRSCPMLLEDYPFIANIPQERIIGDRGEVYCLVPKDQTEITIGSLKVGGFYEIETVQYHSQIGDPLLLVCNYDVQYPDTGVIAKDATGEEMRFYPQIGDMGGIVIPTNDMLEKQVLDFTYYFEVYQDVFSAYMAQGWYFPNEAHIISTCWNYWPDTYDNGCWVLNCNGDGTVELELTVEGVPATDTHYEGTWCLSYSDSTGLVYLELFLLRDDGEPVDVAYAVLGCPYDNGILLGVHEGQEGLPVLTGDERISIWWGSVG